jgi:hypothetical protein
MTNDTMDGRARVTGIAALALAAVLVGCWESENPAKNADDDETEGPGEGSGTAGVDPGPGSASAVDDQPDVDPSDSHLDGQAGEVEEDSPLPDDLPELPAMPCVAPEREEYKAAHADPDDEDAGKEHTILFVFDKSGSMSGSWEEGDKWSVAAAAMVDSVALFQSYLSAGAIFFPSYSDCGVLPIEFEPQIDFTSGSAYLGAWESSMGALGPEGSTPMNTAFERADAAIRDACDDGILEQPFKVVLLSDGEPNCEYSYEYLLAYPAHWLDHGIETLVIGLPGSESAAALLGMIALAGGTESEFTPDDPGDFEDEMDTVCE